MMFLLGEDKEKYILSKAVRIEIVAVIANLMMLQTRFPVSEDYTSVCRRLIEKYPQLQDVIGNGYVSVYSSAVLATLQTFMYVQTVSCITSSFHIILM